MRCESFRSEWNEASCRHSRRFPDAVGPACLQPVLLDVLQHGKGNFERWATSHQQRSCSAPDSTAWIHDAWRVDGVPLQQKAGSRKKRASRSRGHVVNRGSLSLKKPRYRLVPAERLVKILRTHSVS